MLDDIELADQDIASGVGATVLLVAYLNAHDDKVSRGGITINSAAMT
jgi:hypothetical protein